MSTVTLDVPAAQDAASRLGRLSATIDEQVERVRRAASLAREDVPSLSAAPVWVDGLRTRATDLRSRVDLALALTDDADLGPVTYEVPVDTGRATRTLLGEAFGLQLLSVQGDEEQGREDLALLQRWRERAEPWVDHPDVAPALVESVGEALLEVTARTGRVGFHLDGADASDQPGGSPAGTTLPAARLVRRALAAASRGWDEQRARQAGADLAASATAGATTGAGLALSFLLQDGSPHAALVAGVADGLDQAERTAGRPLDLTGARAAALGNELVDAFGDDEGAAADPMALALRALAGAPRLALDWFDGEQGLARQQHWVGQRSWAHDRARGILAAVAAATSDPSLLVAGGAAELPSLRHRCAALTSTALPLLARRREPLPPSEDLAHLLARWLPALDAALSWTAPPDEDDPPRALVPAVVSPRLEVYGRALPPLPVLLPADLPRLLAAAAADPAGRGVLRSGLDDHAGHALACAADLLADADADADERAQRRARQHAQTVLVELAVREGAVLAALPVLPALPASTWDLLPHVEALPFGARGAPAGSGGAGDHLDLHRHLATGRTPRPGSADADALVAAWDAALRRALAARGLPEDAAGRLDDEFWAEIAMALTSGA